MPIGRPPASLQTDDSNTANQDREDLSECPQLDALRPIVLRAGGEKRVAPSVDSRETRGPSVILSGFPDP